MLKLLTNTLVVALLLPQNVGAENKPSLQTFHAEILSKRRPNTPPIKGLANVSSTVPFGAIMEVTRWHNKTIPVCWENAGAANAQAMAWTRDAVQQSWAKVSRLKFVGWQQCDPINNGIRIQVADEGARVKTLGWLLNNFKNGMVLNFNFQNWHQECQSSREQCIRAIAVHEFGHAIGFTHEQNRADTPGECALLAQGPNPDTLLTSYDPDSVMNYCSKDGNNGGKLSARDIKSVVAAYGAP